MLMEDIERGDELFASVKRTSDGSGQTYAQVIKNGSGGWTVERRDGVPDSHFSVDVGTMREAHTILTNWAFEIPQEPIVEWTRVEF